MPAINSYTINQFDSYFDNWTIVLLTFTDRFHQDKSTTFNRFTRFQRLTQLQLEFYYHVKKLNNTSLNYGRKNYYCNSTYPFKVQAKGNFSNMFFDLLTKAR